MDLFRQGNPQCRLANRPVVGHRRSKFKQMVRAGTHAISFQFPLLLVGLFLCPMPVLAQATGDGQEHQDFARPSKEIALQNESQWEDNRWQRTDVGPFLAASIKSEHGQTLKGIAIRVGDKGEAAVCFDTARMRISSAWTGDFLEFGARRFGLIDPPVVAGTTFFSTEKLAGWALDDRFQPALNEITHPEVATWYESNVRTETRLPKEWAHYNGHYAIGKRVVLSYTVGKSSVLESPWFVRLGDQDAFIRSLEIGPSTTEMSMIVAGIGSRFEVIGSADIRSSDHNGSPVLIIEPHEEAIRIKLLITKVGTEADAIHRLRVSVGEPEDLSKLIKDDPGRFSDVLVTEGKTSKSENAYVIDTLTLPFENQWRALLFTSGHDFFSNGRAAVCTAHGDVWTVDGIDRELKTLQWRRFATGLHQPLGLKIVRDKIYVMGRSQITRLHDRNEDGEADFYENFNNDLIVAPRPHDYVTCLETDSVGNFYFIHAKTGVMKVAADGTAVTSLASGFRNPNGMGVSPQGLITAAPQQGSWTPESSLIVVKEGGYYGFGGPKVTPTRPSGWDLPMCFIPRSMDNSGGGQVWVEGDRWGPLTGKMLHLSYGQCRMLLALTEESNGVFQGGTIQFPTTPSDFESGIMRGRFSPHDGQLYVSGLRGWQTRSIRDGCFQRVRYTGEPVNVPVDVTTYANGIKLTFSQKLDQEFAENPGNYFVEQWNYKFSKDYGSPDFSVINPEQQGRDEVVVESATLMDDGTAVFLEMPGREPVNQINISWLLRSVDGEGFRGSFAHTINYQPLKSIPDTEIVRRERRRYVTAELEARLKSGLKFEFRSLESGETDVRVERLVAMNQLVDSPPTPFLPAGPFQLTIDGTLRIPLRGFYHFKLDGAENAQLWINDDLTLNASQSRVTAEPVLLDQGQNRVRISYASPKQGNALLQLAWKGDDFGWEPVPPNLLFHDSESEQLASANTRRLGRELFADHRCAACHQVDLGGQSMLELSFSGPDLKTAGDRFSSQWMRNWIVSPSSFRSDSHMPALLGGGKQSLQDASDIAAFLESQLSRKRDDQNLVENTQQRLDDGKLLYEDFGCISCHHFDRPGSDDQFHRLSLYFTNQKYRSGALREFLKNPEAHHTAIRMPNFSLNDEEASALAAFIRQKSNGKLESNSLAGNSDRGRTLFSDKGCQQCHQSGLQSVVKPPFLRMKLAGKETGCLAGLDSPSVPRFAFSADQRRALKEFVSSDLDSLKRVDHVETSHRLFGKLGCVNCHDRDGHRSQRSLAMIEDGSGGIPEIFPALTWSGEKLQPAWTEAMLSGQLNYKPRPWLRARMPAFPAYARSLSYGQAAEHGVGAGEVQPVFGDSDLAQVGRELSVQTGLDCLQCHAVGDQQPHGDDDTKLALGINFAHIRDRMRPEAYQRFMMDPPRYDIKTRMVRLSEDGRTTKLKGVFDGDANKQFEAIWHYIQSLKDD